MTTLLDARPRQDEFLDRCDALGVLDAALVADTAQRTVRYLTASASQRDALRPAQALERRWYESLEAGTPDYDVYADDLYLSDLWSCWRVYSRGYLRSVRTLGLRPQTVVDLGCGLGYTTAALSQLYPLAVVYGTNLPGLVQTRYAEELGLAYGFDVLPEPMPVHADLVFASEYFEHFPQPIEHLADILDRLHPHVLITANSFGPRSVGHFDEYDVGEERLTPAGTSRRFTALMRQRGYRKQETGFWNGRPTIWVQEAGA